MVQERDYSQDVAEIRSIMERSTKFLSLSGLSGIMAGVYALIGYFIAGFVLEFQPNQDYDFSSLSLSSKIVQVIALATSVLVLALITAIFLSKKKAKNKDEQAWNPTARRMVRFISVPLVTGGLLALILANQGLTQLMVPLTLIFYGLALFNASKFTYEDIRVLGLFQIVLGILSTYFVEYSLLFWAAGFGAGHIVYGLFMHLRYEQ